MIRDWEEFLAPYEQAVSELKVKLRGIRKQYREQNKHVPIEFVTGRVKPVDSILTKSKLRGIALDRLEEEMSDIAGLRIMCQFVEDIHQVVELIDGEKIILAEIQIRTLAMNFWATIEHSLNYKYQGEFPAEISERLRRSAEAAYQLDEEMSNIREEIQEAQRLFSHGKGKRGGHDQNLLPKGETE